MPRPKQKHPKRKLIASRHSRTCDACGFGLTDEACRACAHETTFPWDPRIMHAPSIEQCHAYAACAAGEALPTTACAYCGRAARENDSYIKTVQRGLCTRVVCDAVCEAAYHFQHVVTVVEIGLASKEAGFGPAADSQAAAMSEPAAVPMELEPLAEKPSIVGRMRNAWRSCRGGSTTEAMRLLIEKQRSDYNRQEAEQSIDEESTQGDSKRRRG